ncbi:DUF4145 domain-containing protein [Alicyclobacillus fastidiosus]|uniref:DUF4145 domain-containing protein n=1 Tax=Alicyclobacillus fastidiosus TaxID=392011 RepID=A0ABY6ZEN0_9BACL|nr:DUF4145 domain-containing protein [Alicyclobacillus fastidiosus]WAH41355.1 DUF4145 domain-containing protein [Alicyclobacillus fastidiosus]GMA62965.1 hypothetical protein GCM10025859_34050 [Alicyclobacillus fastidiosus]
MSLRRTLEMMCKDQGANGKDLYTKLKQLSHQRILPPILSEMGDILKLLGSAAAHGDDAEFDDDVISAIVDFTQIILDYVYNIPVNLKVIQHKITDKGFRKQIDNQSGSLDTPKVNTIKRFLNRFGGFFYLENA